LATNKFIKLA